MKTKKALYNTISELLFQVIACVCGLILPKLILETYGSAYNGMIQTIIRFLRYISVLTLGIMGPTSVAIYKALAEKNDRKLHAILRANEKYMRKVGGALVIYTLLLACIYPYLVQNVFGWWDVASLVLIIGLGELVEYVFGSSSRLLLQAEQKTYMYTTLMIASKIISTFTAFFLVRRGSSIQCVRMVMVVSFAIPPIVIDIIMKRAYHIDVKAEPDYSAIKQRGDAIAHSISAIVDQNAPILLLTLFADPIAASVYSIYDLILYNIQKIQEAFTNHLEGAFGEFWAKGEKEKFCEKFDTLEYLIISFLLVVYTTTGVLILPFMEIYTAGVTDANYILPLFSFFFVVATAADSLRAPYNIAVRATGKYRDTKKLAIREAAITASVSFVGVLTCGISGIILGILSANLYRVIGYAYFCYRKMLDIPIIQFVKRMSWLIVSSAVTVAIQMFLTNHVMVITGWMQWAVAGFICVCVAGTILLISSVLFYRQELIRAFHLVKVMLGRKK